MFSPGESRRIGGREEDDTKTTVIGCCVQGANHIRSGTVCQDSMKKLLLPDGTLLLAVADGHGSRECPWSKTGSAIAVNVFCSILFQAWTGWGDRLYAYLSREGELTVPKDIEKEWKKRVRRQHLRMKREIPAGPDGQASERLLNRQYGTTLLGMMIAPSFIYAFQLGDGDLFMLSREEPVKLIEPERILGVETYSLSQLEAWKKACTKLLRLELRKTFPLYFTLSTDGFANSHSTDEEFMKSIRAYMDLLRENRLRVLRENLKTWLQETSALGCGDDITLMLARCDGDTDRDRDSDTESDTDTDTESDTDTDKDMDKDMEKDIEKDMDKDTDIDMDKGTDMDKDTDRDAEMSKASISCKTGGKDQDVPEARNADRRDPTEIMD